MRRGLVASRGKAQELIADGRVLVGGASAEKPGRLVSPGESVQVLGEPEPYVGRGGRKLEAALDRFGVQVAGRRALDAGSSTGGFVDCLLQRGAASVVAVDVGRGQLDPRLRSEARVEVREGVNVRHLTPELLSGRTFDLLTVDLSFISLRSVVHPLLGPLAQPGADVLALVKPQFEAGRAQASRGRGVVRDPIVWSQVLLSVGRSFIRAGAAMMGVMPSPLTGARGNVEFFVHATAHTSSGGVELEEAVRVAIQEARG